MARLLSHRGQTRAYLVDKITCFIDSPDIREFHYDMFHGVVVPDDDCRTIIPRVVGSNGLRPLQIMRNVYNAPDVFAPATNFVVSERVRYALSKLPNVAFLAIQCAKLIDYPYRVGDFSWYEDPECRRPAGLYSLLDGVQQVDAVDSTYTEILTTRLADVQSSFNGLVSVDAEIGPVGSMEPLSVMLSTELLANYPILFTPEAKILSAAAFSILRPFLNPVFFAITELELLEGGT